MKMRYVLLALTLLVATTGCGDDGDPLAPELLNKPVVPLDALAVVQGPVTNPANGHVYYRLENSNWSDAEENAVRMLGGHLVTVDDLTENSFVLSTFANSAGRVWLGLNDVATEGTFVYSSGAPLGYSNWEPGEPNNRDDEDYVAMYSGNGRWLDVKDLANPPGIGWVYGVVEVE